MEKKAGKAIFGLLMVAIIGIGIVSVSAMAANTSHSERVADVHDRATKVLETEESAQLAHLAKITPEDAKAIVLKEIGGDIKKVELDNENGNVVYSVELTKDKKGLDVKIDAGNGKILGVDTGVDDETESELNHADGDNIEHEFEDVEEQQ